MKDFEEEEEELFKNVQDRWWDVRKGTGLMDYGVPGGNNGSTVIYSNVLNNGNATHIPRSVQEYLLESPFKSIRNVVTGHQPHGDCPCIIRTGQVTFITADTSYSQMGHTSSWGVDNRGEAVCEVLLHEDGTSEVHGVLADGSKIAYKLAADGTGDPFVGRQLSDGSWIKGRTAGAEPEYIICRGEGYKLTVSRRKEWEMKGLVETHFVNGEEAEGGAAAKKKARVDAANRPPEDNENTRAILMQELKDLKQMHDDNFLDADDYSRLKSPCIKKLEGLY